MKKKPRWDKPKLLILIRGKPEEMVLGFCKAAGGSPVDVFNCCYCADCGNGGFNPVAS